MQSNQVSVCLLLGLVLVLASNKQQQVTCKTLLQQENSPLRQVNWAPLILSSSISNQQKKTSEPNSVQNTNSSSLFSSLPSNSTASTDNTNQPPASSESSVTLTSSSSTHNNSYHNKEPINRLVPVLRHSSSNSSQQQLVAVNPTAAPSLSLTTTASPIQDRPVSRQQQANQRGYLAMQDLIETSGSNINEMVAPQASQQVSLSSSDEHQDRDSDQDDEDSDSAGEQDSPSTELVRGSQLHGESGGNKQQQSGVADLSDYNGPTTAETRRSNGRQSSFARSDDSRAQQQQQQQYSANSQAGGGRQQAGAPSRGNQGQEDEETQVRREQEAAEASEAELADRSALDEQQQAQREIILAQAQSEARAIKEQQESLMKQQLLQQQMITRRHHEIEGNRSQVQQPNGKHRDAQVSKANRRQNHQLQHRLSANEGIESTNQQNRQQQLQMQQQAVNSRARAHLLERRVQPVALPSRNIQQQQQQLDSQFSDQPERRAKAGRRDSSSSSSPVTSDDSDQAASSTRDEVFDYSIRQFPASLQEVQLQQQQPQDSISLPTGLPSSSAEFESSEFSTSGSSAPLPASPSVGESGSMTKFESPSGLDLTPAAQHAYGAHYDSIGSHTKNYYQFAESFKKGQFHSGYKRGGKKLQISGHSSQHKDHAEGHIKWNGKKGKGSSYWDYQHSPKSGHHYDGHKDEHYHH